MPECFGCRFRLPASEATAAADRRARGTLAILAMLRHSFLSTEVAQRMYASGDETGCRRTSSAAPNSRGSPIGTRKPGWTASTSCFTNRERASMFNKNGSGSPAWRIWFTASSAVLKRCSASDPRASRLRTVESRVRRERNTRVRDFTPVWRPGICESDATESRNRRIGHRAVSRRKGDRGL